MKAKKWALPITFDALGCSINVLSIITTRRIAYVGDLVTGRSHRDSHDGLVVALVDVVEEEVQDVGG